MALISRALLRALFALPLLACAAASPAPAIPTTETPAPIAPPEPAKAPIAETSASPSPTGQELEAEAAVKASRAAEAADKERRLASDRKLLAFYEAADATCSDTLRSLDKRAKSEALQGFLIRAFMDERYRDRLRAPLLKSMGTDPNPLADRARELRLEWARRVRSIGAGAFDRAFLEAELEFLNGLFALHYGGDLPKPYDTDLGHLATAHFGAILGRRLDVEHMLRDLP